MYLTPDLCKKARKILGWSQEELSHQTKLAQCTLSNFEVGKGCKPATVAILKAMFEKHGLSFENDDVVKVTEVTFKKSLDGRARRSL
jgi:predicted transcriptional regulator